MGFIYNVLSLLGEIHQGPYPVTQDQKISSNTVFLCLKRGMNFDVWYRRFADRDRWRALVSTVMNLWVPKMRGIS
jgi:hypothetical protein